MGGTELEPVVQTDDRFDALDRDQFREMIESKAFRAFLDRVKREMDRGVHDCRVLDDIGEIRYAQGRSWVAEWVLNLPLQMLAEMTKSAAKKR